MSKEAPLILDTIHIHRMNYGDHEGCYSASVKYKGDAGEVKLNLSPEMSNEFMRFCGNAIKKFSDAATLELKDAIDESVRIAGKETGE